MLHVSIQVLPHAEGLALPEYKTPGSSGMDLKAAISDPVTVAPGRVVLIPTGLKVALPDDYEFQVRPRSGLAANHGIMVLNSPGTIDADYRGEVQVILANFGQEPFTIIRGARIAQLVLARVERFVWRVTPALDETQRGSGGFGHTGVH